ncbi:UNVERIFIED_CONTAM: hypothetical protein K2H54_037636 [Gekko kuhli]
MTAATCSSSLLPPAAIPLDPERMGFSSAQRKIASLAKPKIIITVDKDLTTIRTETAFKVNEISFRLGQEFEEITLDNRKAKCYNQGQWRSDSCAEMEWQPYYHQKKISTGGNGVASFEICDS